MSVRQPLLAVELTLVASQLISREELDRILDHSACKYAGKDRPSWRGLPVREAWGSHNFAPVVSNSYPCHPRHRVPPPTVNLVAFIVAVPICAVATGGIGELIRRNRRKDFGGGFNRPVSRYRMTYAAPAFYRTSVRTRRVDRRGLTLQTANEIFFCRIDIYIGIEQHLRFLAFNSNLAFS